MELTTIFIVAAILLVVAAGVATLLMLQRRKLRRAAVDRVDQMLADALAERNVTLKPVSDFKPEALEGAA